MKEIKNIIYGGSFDPFHSGHINVINIAKSNYPNANIVISPTTNHPFDKEMMGIKERLYIIMEMIKFNMLKNITISICEKYMYRFLWDKQFRPDNTAILIGSDIIPEIDKWEDFNYLNKYLFLIVERGLRGGELYDIEKLNYFQIIGESSDKTSSTEIKKDIKSGSSWAYRGASRNTEEFIKKTYGGK